EGPGYELDQVAQWETEIGPATRPGEASLALGEASASLPEPTPVHSLPPRALRRQALNQAQAGAAPLPTPQGTEPVGKRSPLTPSGETPPRFPEAEKPSQQVELPRPGAPEASLPQPLSQEETAEVFKTSAVFSKPGMYSADVNIEASEGEQGSEI